MDLACVQKVSQSLKGGYAKLRDMVPATVLPSRDEPDWMKNKGPSPKPDSITVAGTVAPPKPPAKHPDKPSKKPPAKPSAEPSPSATAAS